MKVGIGIDTGGTYTDAVIYDFAGKEILGSAKALTTKEDLSLGIGNALDSLDAELLKQAEMVSLSTTLATNACIENKGGRAKLLFIGVDKSVVGKVGHTYGFPNIEDIYFLESEASFYGEIIREPDWAAFLEDSREWFKDAESIGIVEIYAMKNNAVLEKKARELIGNTYHLPVMCGHELFSDLNSIQRGSSTLLNARLIPIIAGFLEAIKSSLRARGIHAPVVIVRSDGSLMSESFTGIRPVETLLCGPAASVMGGFALTDEKDSLIIDMGGTTTDIAIIKDGVPVQARDGIHVGKWRTFVKGVYIDTFGLGGDSALRYDNHDRLVMETTRIIPLAVAASRWPSVTEKLEELLASKKKHSIYLHEFYCLVQDISNNPNYTPEEQSFCGALKNGPLIYSEAAAAIDKDIYSLKMDRLEKEGIVMRCGLTPTDIMHIRGDFSSFCTEASVLGAKFVANCTGMSVDALCSKVYDKVKKTLYCNIVRMLLEDQFPQFKKHGLDHGLETLIAESWDMAMKQNYKPLLNFTFNTPAALVGIGAPIHIFLPDVARVLGTRCIVPPNAGVANAVGAIVGNISAVCEIEIKPDYSAGGRYTVFGRTGNRVVQDRDEAIGIALEEAKAAAWAEALSRGAEGDLTVKTEVITDAYAEEGKAEVCFGIKAVATAVGRVML